LYLKASKVGFDDTISGKGVYPVFNDLDVVTYEEKNTLGIKQFTTVKQVRVDGCHDQQRDLQIRW
jgi:hypothetical protein